MPNGVRTTSAAQALVEAHGPPTDNPLILRLYDRQRDFDGFGRAMDEARHLRDAAVRDAVRGGVARDEVRKLTGLSLSRISQITHYRR